MTLLWSIKIATTNCFPWVIEEWREKGNREFRKLQRQRLALCQRFNLQATAHKHTHTDTAAHHTHTHHTYTHVQAISHNYHVHAMGPLGTKGNREPTNGPGGGTKHDQLDHMFCKKLHYKSSGGSGGW